MPAATVCGWASGWSIWAAATSRRTTAGSAGSSIPFGEPLDGAPLLRGAVPRRGRGRRAERRMTAARWRRGWRPGWRCSTPSCRIVRGQRIGLFAGSGVGKSTLLGRLTRGIEADVVVIALIGERGRELREFVDRILGPQGMARTVVVAATSDQPALVRRRCAWTAMAVAEHFRDGGRQVLLLADSLTRFAEAHREIALAAGETGRAARLPALDRGDDRRRSANAPGPGMAIRATSPRSSPCWSPGRTWRSRSRTWCAACSTAMWCSTAAIAERGRFPAVDLLRSVSRSLPEAADCRRERLLTPRPGAAGRITSGPR